MAPRTTAMDGGPTLALVHNSDYYAPVSCFRFDVHVGHGLNRLEPRRREQVAAVLPAVSVH